jgi:hypothetical protein
VADREQGIRVIAHRIWEEAGRPFGQEDHHWKKADQIVAIEEDERATLMYSAHGRRHDGPQNALSWLAPSDGGRY